MIDDNHIIVHRSRHSSVLLLPLRSTDQVYTRSAARPSVTLYAVRRTNARKRTAPILLSFARPESSKNGFADPAQGRHVGHYRCRVPRRRRRLDTDQLHIRGQHGGLAAVRAQRVRRGHGGRHRTRHPRVRGPPAAGPQEQPVRRPRPLRQRFRLPDHGPMGW